MRAASEYCQPTAFLHQLSAFSVETFTCNPQSYLTPVATATMSETRSLAGFDVATVLTGSGLTLLISAGIGTYAEQFRFNVVELYGIAGAVLVVLGLLFGLVLVASR